ncbi:two component transcriptional regulator, LytTR family [Chitinophaga rupis]|uniref:Two component transcriptional regulator, LytTR family n=1 Tax=Chitinophaga rupis TaxID=573321 RepID=A0A1H8JTA7_9BACT|nr:LytTR family DNA-binding domain-containing protein [Chitinophaga rupis]SEN83536.1 two component transcriptional regulator, LytTR family [Chitinophaga rupis]
MIQCFIVDDEQHAIDVIANHIKEVHFLELVGTSTNPVSAIQQINEGKMDLVFLDVQMPKLSGLDLIKAITRPVQFILCTAYSEFAAAGFDLEVLDYLMKPVPFPRFLKAAHRAFDAVSSKVAYSAPQEDDDIEGDYIFVKIEVKGKMLKINLADIDYIEGMKNYIAIYHNGTKTMALLSMKDIEERLPKKHFMRVHKSFIVAVKRIAMIEGNTIRLNQVKAEVPIGETYKSVFFELMKKKIMD